MLDRLEDHDVTVIYEAVGGVRCRRLQSIAAPARKQPDFLLTLSATGRERPAQISYQCARHRLSLLATGALCSRFLPMGSLNPSSADAFAKRLSRTVLTSGRPRDALRSSPAGKAVRMEGFCEQRAAHRTGTDIRLRLNKPNRAGRDRPVWDEAWNRLASASDRAGTPSADSAKAKSGLTGGVDESTTG